MQSKLFPALLLLTLSFSSLPAQIIPTGSGSYTRTFPGTDQAGRNSYPSSTPQVSGDAASRPIPTNDWWSKAIKENHADNLFNYPLAMKTIPSGLILNYLPSGPMDDRFPVTLGTESLNAGKVTVADHSDWTVTLDWRNDDTYFRATTGIGMPFVYMTQDAQSQAKVVITTGTVTVDAERIIVANAKNGASFVIYAPVGSTWTRDGSTYRSALNGKGYWSAAMLPHNTTDVPATARDYQRYAYVFPASTEAGYAYDEQLSVVKTTFRIVPDVKEGSYDKVLTGLLPHQWNNLTDAIPEFLPGKYNSIRGELRLCATNLFTTGYTYHGILPTLPFPAQGEGNFNMSLMAAKISGLKDEELSSWTDSYNEGQVMNRLIQTARIADQCGMKDACERMTKTIRERMENWLSAREQEVAFLFYYNKDWTTLIGYPAGHGQDSNLNDHHFHWGYFIHAAAFVEQMEPGWAEQWGPMVNLLIRDAASDNRSDDMFPYLRNFSPYAGHCWANGFATFPQGNDQESTSESMQFNSSLIHWGTITGNKAIRDLGIYLYATEQSAIGEYWFDEHQRNFRPTQQHALVSRVWGNDYDNGTFWTGDIAASYGIELYPIHGGSLYLANNPEYAARLWKEMAQNTGILRNEVNANLWHDVYWCFLSLTNPAEAIRMYDSYPKRELKFGISDAQTYHWLHAINSLGSFDTSVTADYPVATAFRKNGEMVYAAHNYGADTLSVNYSDGYVLKVPPRTLATNREESETGNLSPVVSIMTSVGSGQVLANTKVSIEVFAYDPDGTVEQVSILANGEPIAQFETAPYTTEWVIPAGEHTITAIARDNEGETTTAQITLSAVDSFPCDGTAQNDDYTYVFSSDPENPTITFVPKQQQYGSSVCILYYGTNPSEPMPGYLVKPNEPFRITASNSSVVYFYYTYSTPQGEKNTMNMKDSFIIGSCSSVSSTATTRVPEVRCFPNPVNDQLMVTADSPIERVILTDLAGRICYESAAGGTNHLIGMKSYPAGSYILRVCFADGFSNLRVIRE